MQLNLINSIIEEIIINVNFINIFLKEMILSNF